MLRGSTPEHIVLGLVVFYLWSKYGWLVKSRFVKSRFNSEWIRRWHWFHFFYCYLGYLLVLALKSVFFDVLVNTQLLDTKVTSERVRLAMVAAGHEHDWEKWREDASLEHYPGLRWLSVLSPVWVVATFGLCYHHTRKHAECMGDRLDANGRVNECFELHEKVIRILLLPVIYCLMSLHGVVYMWGVVANVVDDDRGHFSSWHQRSHYYTEMYHSAFYVGDIYESFALLVLGELIMMVLERKVQATFDDKAAQDRDAAELQGPVHDQSTTSLSCAFISAIDLYREMKALTTFGIKFFCWTCGCQATYQLTVAWMGYYHIMEPIFGLGDGTGEKKGLAQKPETVARSEYFFLGAGCVASFAAIGNIMKIESAFHKHLMEFRPFWKFWGTKMLVSIAFLQSMALAMIPPFCTWSPIRVNLLYGSVLCLECFIVSLVHLHAWGHDQSWYGHEEVLRVEQDEDSMTGSSAEFEGEEEGNYGADSPLVDSPLAGRSRELDPS